MTKITLLTACYNSAATIRDTLKSIEVQTYANIEHIIVDGASKDNTLEVVKAEGRRVDRVVSGPDKGIYDAYNKGLALATGEVIGFLNSDDFYAHPRVIEQVMAKFDADPSLDAVHANLVYVDRDDVSKVTRLWRSQKSTAKRIQRGFYPAHPTLFLRRRVYERAGGFDLSYRMAADGEFMGRIFGRFGITDAHVDDIWVIMRDGGTTGGNWRSIARQNSELRRGLRANGIKSSPTMFLVAKIIDRTLQRSRARNVVLPALGFEP